MEPDICFERLGEIWEISIFYAVLSPLMFLLKTLHPSYVNCNEFHKHEIVFMIMVQQVPRRWNISLNLSEYVLYDGTVCKAVYYFSKKFHQTCLTRS